MFKLSREQFYKNHHNEIEKYIHPFNSVLHITSKLSENKYNQDKYDTLYIDSAKDLEFKEFSHGQSVAIGMLMAMELSKNEEGFLQEDINRSKELITKANPNINLINTFDDKRLIENMSVDKKRSGNKMIFIVLNRIGQAKIKTDIKEAEIAKAIKSSD